jgi:hypothetical protein
MERYTLWRTVLSSLGDPSVPISTDEGSVRQEEVAQFAAWLIVNAY